MTIPAEVAGAAWDEDVEASEVSALLARLVAEGKLKSTTPSTGQMNLKLSVPRETFEGYERELIEKLFFEGDETSADRIQAHYASSGFNPTNVIKSGVLRRAPISGRSVKEPSAWDSDHRTRTARRRLLSFSRLERPPRSTTPEWSSRSS